MTLIETSPARHARVTGLIYLLYFATAICGALCVKGIVVPNDPALTARNVLDHAPAFHASFALGLISDALYIVLTVLLYQLLRPAGRTVALVATVFSVAGCTVQIFGSIFHLAPLAVLGLGSPYAIGFGINQAQRLTMLFFSLELQAVNVALVLFALFCLLLGYLIVRSTFLPRILGFLIMLAGVGWLSYLWPPLGASLARIVQPFGFLAELVLMLWLLIKGVNSERWREKAATTASLAFTR